MRARHLLGLRGWAIVKGEQSQGSEVLALLYDSDTRRPRYSLPLDRHDRQDVASHLGSS
jgi:hypothetical protein